MAYNGAMSQISTQSPRPISVRNERVCRLAHELAEIMECSLTEAIRVALREYHDQEKHRIDAAASTKEYIRRIAPDMFDELYCTGDEDDEPRRCPHCHELID